MSAHDCAEQEQRPNIDVAEKLISLILENTARVVSVGFLDTDAKVESIIPAIHEIYSVIAQTTVDHATEQMILTDARIASSLGTLRGIFSDCECAYEEIWAAKIVASQTLEKAHETLKTYPMLHVYDFLISLEWNAARTVLRQFPQKIAMLGSGPLPITPIRICDLAQEQGEKITKFHLIERYADRVQRSMDVLNKFQGYGNISHQIADAADPVDLTEFDAVYVAILVGTTIQEKEELLLSIVERMRKGAVIITRGGRGLKGLVYPEVDPLTLRLREKLHPVIKVDSYGKPGIALTASVVVSQVL